MSTFLGQIFELPGISVDRFDGANLNSSVYFLSHCHTDHMKGLGNDFFNHLRKFDKYLYCSPISKAFLLGIYQGAIEDRIKVIEMTIPKTINYAVRENDMMLNTSLIVTTSPAGHCPGSVMFVFNQNEKTILYTGDFRVNPKDLPKLNPLNHKIDGKNYPIKFDAIYLDTTFLSLNFPRLPTRKNSCKQLCETVEEWLRSDPKNVVILECSALYGPEYLFMEISERLKIKVHVKDKVFSNYRRISEIAECVTNDSLLSRVHACTPKMTRETLNCRGDVQRENILTIVPSVQRWEGKCDVDKILEYDSTNNRRLYICYSMHASYAELGAFIDYFKPNKIVPCVCPDESINEIYKLLHKLTNYENIMRNDVSCCSSKLELPVKRTFKPSFSSKYFNDDDNDDDL